MKKLQLIVMMLLAVSFACAQEDDFDGSTMEQPVRKPVEMPWEQVNTARGIAVFNPRTDMTTEDVVRRADESMYANKKSMKQ